MKLTRVEVLLSELCTRLGFCLPARAIVRLREDPPQDVDAFTKAVFEAEGLDSEADRRLWKRVRETVVVHFDRWADEDARDELIDELARYAPEKPKA